MSGFGVLFLRELRRRLPIHLSCLGSGILVLVFPWIPGVSTSSPDTLRGVGAVSVAVLWALVLALLEGFHFLASDLKEGRLAFDFRLPVSGSTIWLARLAAVLLTLAAAVGLSLAPPALAGADVAGGFTGLQQLVFGNSGLEVPHPLLFAKSVVLILLLIANGKALAFASRSARVGMDLSVLVAFGFAAGFSTSAFWRYGATASAGFALELFLTAGAAALLIASWFQLTRGRTEPDRAHAAFTPALAAIGLGAILVLAGGTRWMLNPGPEALTRPIAQSAVLAPNLLWIGGTASHRPGLSFGFLLDPRTGRASRTGPSAFLDLDLSPRSSADGNTVAWRSFERISSEVWNERLFYRRSTAVDAPTLESPLSWKIHQPVAWGLSPDGSLVGSIEGAGPDDPILLKVENLETASLEKKISIPKCHGPWRISLQSNTQALISCGCNYPGDDVITGSALGVDLVAGTWRYLHEHPVCGAPVDERRAYAGVRRYEPADFDAGDELRSAGRIHDQSDTAVALDYPTEFPDRATPGSSRFLADGRLATMWHAERKLFAILYEPTGKVFRKLEVATSASHILAELDDHSLVLFDSYSGWPPGTFAGSALVRLDLQTGETREITRDLQARRPGSAQISTTLFTDKEGRLYWLDLKSGKLSPLLHGS